MFHMFMGERKFIIRVSNFPFRGGNSDINLYILNILFWVNNSLVSYIIHSWDNYFEFYNYIRFVYYYYHCYYYYYSFGPESP